MVGFVEGDVATKVLKLLLIYSIFEALLCNGVVVEKFNTDITLSCPGTSAKWFSPLGTTIVASDKYLFVDGNLTIRKIGDKDLGPYFCIGETNLTVEVHSKPFMKSLDKSYNVVQGNPIDVECVAHAYPLADYTWYKDVDGQKINVSHSSKLFIESSSISDYGVYTCEAVNLHGNSSTSTKIRVKDKLAPLWPLIGILIEVIILVVIIIIYEKKKSKNDAEEGAKDTMQKSNENNASTVRQRK